MALGNLQASHHIISISRTIFPEPNHTKLLFLKHSSLPRGRSFQVTSLSERSNSNVNAMLQQRPPPTATPVEEVSPAQMMVDQTADVGLNDGHDIDDDKGVMIDESLVREYGWKVRRMAEEMSEMKEVAHVQSEAFHEPFLLFDEFFFQLFQADVLASLIYRLKSSPPDRYACLVAEPAKEDDALTKPQHRQLVGVVDIMVLRDNDVLRQLEGAEEYLYVSGIAVLNKYRRRKVATVLLQACEVIAFLWGYQYLVLRAYEVDRSAQALYSKAGYQLVSTDPSWVTWFGRKKRVLMSKRLW